ncbi:TniQ family protein [Streptacidiphilus sp. EB129]|uniref:TniQ family protein n=1 Tax=Streptacidiphilus sp. EB129 TaxID=3156262 RepID=UPI003518A5BF
MTELRTLPIRVSPVPGEALDSWLEMTGHQLHTPLKELLRRLGLGPQPNRYWHLRNWAVQITPEEAASVAATCGTSADRILAMTLSHYDQRAVIFTAATGKVDRQKLWGRATCSRYCPDCLAENGGRWMLTWRLGWSYACLQHRRLLADLCPGCDRMQRRTGFPKQIVPQPGKCVTPLSTRDLEGVGPRCGYDLSSTETMALAPDHPALIGQRLLLGAIEAGTAVFGIYRDHPQPVREMLSDARVLAHQILWRERGKAFSADLPTDLVQAHQLALNTAPQPFGPRATEVRPGFAAPSHASTTAFAVTAALQILTQSDLDAAAALFAQLIGPVDASIVTPSTIRARGRTISTAFRAVQLKALAPHMVPIRALRYRTASALPQDPEPTGSVSLHRARSIPTMFWSAWSLRISPSINYRLRHMRAFLSCMLVAVGTRLETSTITQILGGVVDLASLSGRTKILRSDAAGWEKTERALVRLADYLDSTPAPIDYQRRRTLDYSELLPDSLWTAICRSTGIQTGRGTRLALARNLLFEKLSGLPPEHAPQAFTYRGKAFGESRLMFTAGITTDLAHALEQAALQFLARHGIDDEPVTWQPPLDLLHGLQLPGTDPESFNADDVHNLINVHTVVNGPRPRRLRLIHAATELGTTVEAVLHIAQETPAPAGPGRLDYRHTTPADERIRHLREEVSKDTFEALHATTSLAGIGTRFGIGRTSVAAIRDEHGIAARPSNRTREKPRPTREWMVEQYEERNRSMASIAAELGVSKTTVSRWARYFEVATRSRPEVGSDRHLKNLLTAQKLPRLLWPTLSAQGASLRLARFAEACHHPSLRAAARAMGIIPHNLVSQVGRLERDLGGQLLDRGARHRIQQLTPLGRQVLTAIGEIECDLPQGSSHRTRN